MRVRGYVAVPMLAASLASAACGADAGTTQARQPSSAQPYATNYPSGVGPGADVGPPAQNMPGGGRGSEPPHFKGKP